MLQVEARTQTRKRHYIRKLSQKIQTIADSQLCNREINFDDYLFYLWAKGISYFSANKLPESRAFLEAFIKDLPSEVASFSPWKSVETLIRFCEYQLKKGGTIESSSVKVPILDEKKSTVSITIHGIDLQVPVAIVNSIRTKKLVKCDHPTLSVLYEIRRELLCYNIFRENGTLGRFINMAKGDKDLANVRTFLKAHFAKNLGATSLAKILYSQVSGSLKKGFQFFPVSLKLKQEKSGGGDVFSAKTLIGSKTYGRIVDYPVPVKPIVYDLAFDYLGERPTTASASKAGIFSTFWK